MLGPDGESVVHVARDFLLHDSCDFLNLLVANIFITSKDAKGLVDVVQSLGIVVIAIVDDGESLVVSVDNVVVAGLVGVRLTKELDY